MSSSAKYVAMVLAFAALTAPALATAALGEPADSVSADERSLSAVRRTSTARGAYTVERLESSASTVREFVSPSGVVFAVAWGGVSRPDLSVLLGSYEAPYRRALAASAPTSRRRSRRIESGGVVVETWGHMRAQHGRAYVPALVPPGVTLDEIE